MGCGVLEAGTIKRIHVDKQILARNRKDGTNLPALTIQTSRGSIKALDIRTGGLVHFKQAGSSDDRGRVIKPLSCGARAWAETKGTVYYWT